MKFSFISSTIVGASMVLASPVQKRQDAVVVTQIVPSTTVISVTATVFGASRTAPAQKNGTNFDTLSSNSDINDADGSIVSYSAGASSSIRGRANPNQLGGGPGNSGSILGSGTNDFGTSVYDYSGYPRGFQRQPGQSEDGTYGPDSGPSDDAVSIQTAEDSEGSAPPRSTSTFFRLVANVTGDEDPYGINGYYVGTYHVSAGSSIAHLTSPSGGTGGSSGGSGNGSGGGGRGRVFHTNGTAYEVTHREGTTVTRSVSPGHTSSSLPTM